MSLKPFTYPFPETRFLHSGSSVYKFKIRYGDSIRGEDIENKEVIVQELEDSIRVVLGNLDSLQPFATEHFVVFPYKSKWERVSHLKFKHGEIVLIPYPFVLTLYVELKWFNENLSTGKPIDDSPLGLVPAERKAARAMKKKRKRMELSVSPSRPGLDRASLVSACSSGWTKAADANRWSVRSERAKMRTSCQGPSKKKFLMETSRNMERNTQQKCQETPAFDGTDVQEQAWGLGMGCSYHRYRNVSKRVLHQVVIPCEDTSHGSRWEDNLAGEITPPLQQSNPPPPAGPTDLGTSGFFGFLSSLFPFRYFFRKSSQ